MKSVLDLFLVGKRDDDPEKPYIVYCTEEGAGQRPGYVGEIAGRCPTYLEARAEATNRIINAFQPPWGNPEELADKLAAALGIPEAEAAGRLRRIYDSRSADLPHITCPVCWMTSAHPEDISNGFCNNCRDYTSAESYIQRLGIDASEGNT